MTNTLQTFIYPKDNTYGSDIKYFSKKGSVSILKNGESISLDEKSTVSFNTYYNAFSIPLWKNEAKLKKVYLNISGSGKVRIRLEHFAPDFAQKTVFVDKTITLTQKGSKIQVELNKELSGIVYPRITANTKVKIEGITWQTDEKPKRDVKLGISITHFNRKEYVLPAIDRIQNQLLSLPEWKEKITLLVIDNSKNITEKEAQNATIIPNENTGGSGGFMRGLLYFKKSPGYTHVLFMDDDASLEVESIKRAFQILSFASKENTVVGAALFYEDKPDIYIESGAFLGKDVWYPKYNGDNDVNANSVLHQALSTVGEDEYTGWWFTAFPIKYAKRLVPPFFVRGDDVSFAQLNDFNIVTSNGIAAYAEDFLFKVSDSTVFMDIRNKMIVNTFFNRSWLAMVRFYTREYLNLLSGYRYEDLEVRHLAVQHFLKTDKNYLEENINVANIFGEIKQVAKTRDVSKDENSQVSDAITDFEDSIESKFARKIRRFSLNGILFGKKLDKKLLHAWSWQVDARLVQKYSKVAYYNGETGQVYTTEFDRSKSRHYLRLLMADLLRLTFGHGKVKRRLKKNFDNLTSEEMWTRILKLTD